MTATASADNRIAELHDLMVELGRVELLLDRNRSKPIASIDSLRSRRAHLQQALTRLTA